MLEALPYHSMLHISRSPCCSFESKKVGIHLAQITPRFGMGVTNIDQGLGLITCGRFESSTLGWPANLSVETISFGFGGTTVLSVVAVVYAMSRGSRHAGIGTVEPEAGEISVTAEPL